MRYLLVLILFAQQAYAQWLPQAEYYKVPIGQTGVYQISYQTLKKWGVDLSNNPQNFKIFAGTASELSQTFAGPNLKEIPIEIIGEENQIWNKTDYIRFFAEGPDRMDFVHQNAEKHAFDSQNYVFFVPNSPSLHLAIEVISPKIVDEAKNTIETVLHHENEYRNNTSSGRQWLGEYFGFEKKQKIDFKLQDFDTKQPVKVRAQIAIGADEQSTFAVKNAQGQTLASKTVLPVNRDRYAVKTYPYQLDFDWNIDQPNLQFEYQTSSQNYLAFLDKVLIKGQRKLSGEAFVAQNSGQNLDCSGSSKRIFAYSSPHQIMEILHNQNRVQLDTSAGNKLFFFANSQAKELTVAEKISPQRLQLAAETEMLIVATKHTMQAARKYAASKDIPTEVRYVGAIYDAFSSGKTDPTAIRNYIYQNKNQLKYVLLFADATFDAKNNIGLFEFDPTAYIPTFQSTESEDPLRSYSSDDYFGMMQGTGQWAEDPSGNRDIDIAIGRWPVKSGEEAELLVQKMMAFQDSKQKWKPENQHIFLVADDGDYNEHLKNSERLAEIIENDWPINKLYIDAYDQDSLNNLGAEGAINQIFTQNALHSLMVNYTGHGGKQALAQERIFTFAEAQSVQNFPLLPLIFTATCEFGRFDDPLEISSAELALKNPTGGAWALCTTTRPVFSSTNFAINQAWMRAFAEDPTQPVGQIFRKTKNRSFSDVYNRNFTLLADPSLALPLPQRDVEILQNENEITVLSKNNRLNTKAAYQIFSTKKQQLTKGYRSTKTRFQNREIIQQGLIIFENGKAKLDIYSSQHDAEAQIAIYAVDADSMGAHFGIKKIQIVKNIEDKEPPQVSLIDGTIQISDNQPWAVLNDIYVPNTRIEINHKKININNLRNNQIDSKSVLIDIKDFLDRTDTIQVSAIDFSNNSTQKTFYINQTENQDLKTKVWPNPVEEFVYFDIKNPFVGTKTKCQIEFYLDNGTFLAVNTKEFTLGPEQINFAIPNPVKNKVAVVYRVVLETELGTKRSTGRLVSWK